MTDKLCILSYTIDYKIIHILGVGGWGGGGREGEGGFEIKSRLYVLSHLLLSILYSINGCQLFLINVDIEFDRKYL